ncbi:M48 family metalloprotease [Fulvivirga sp. M361]|nr:M48 family metalloprotease [Fulvivirga sp. M361]
MLMSESQEKEMGKASDPDIIAYFGLYDDPDLQRFITDKGKEMASISHRPELGYEFKIVDSPVINAFAVPGGYVYFTRGIMAHFNNEAEFAGVLGHEIGHITARHSAKQYSRSMVTQVGLTLGSVLSPRFAQFSELAQSGTGILSLKFGRDAERQSDKLGVSYSTTIGYDAHEMADFFKTLQRMSENSGQAVPNFLSTHPQPGERYATVHRLASKRQSSKAGPYLVNRDKYLERINGLVYGEDPRQGFVEGEKFYHPELKFVFDIPEGWQLQNTPQQVQMAPDDGSSLAIFTLSNQQTLSRAAEQVLTNYNFESLKQSNTTINGMPAIKIDVQQVQEQQTIKGIIHLVSFDSRIYMFLGITSASDFAQNRTVLNVAANSFQRLTDRSKLRRQPERIKIQTVSGTRLLQQQLANYGIKKSRYQELAILNGMELNDNVVKGTKIKLVQ